MAQTHTKTAIAFQGGGALGAYAFGALKCLCESEPAFRPSCVSGVSIGAFTAAIVVSHPDDPIPKLQAFWDDVEENLEDLDLKKLFIFLKEEREKHKRCSSSALKQDHL